MMRETISGLWEELKELPAPGPRARTCLMATLAVTLGVTAALALHLQDVWWAAISAFMSTQATWPTSLQRAAMRIVGTMAGAGLAILLAPVLVHDHVAGSLLVLTFATVGGIGSLVSQHGYAWLFMGITANLILPSTIDTQANRQAMPGADTTQWVKPQTISSLIVWLARDAGTDVNGAAIPIYGAAL